LKINIPLFFSLLFNGHFPGEPGLAGFIEAKDDGNGGDNWSYKSYKAPVKSSPSANQQPAFYRPNALPVAINVKAPNGMKFNISITLFLFSYHQAIIARNSNSL